ncbi:MAG TPA: glycosyltransferase family 4 protein [Dehalococcoidia bacterium]|nr:glycosyltransferase family 4 protein [Dehalococcoidia bacterium]
MAPLWENVPPPAYGGTEAVVHDLTEGLVAAGHDVTLFATGESVTAARHRSVYPRPLRSEHQLKEKAPYEYVHAASALAEAADGYDIIHNHAGGLPIAFSRLITTPMLSTKHCLIEPDWEFVWRKYGGYYNTISRRAHACMPTTVGGTYVGHVYNGVDVESFPYSTEKQDYLLFLSRIAPEKAPHFAIHAARKAGMKNVIAGKVDPNPTDEQYFDQVVRPLIDGKDVVWFGEADAAQKRELYRDARALLLPIVWEEPFGLVMVEAMACGTPAIVFRRGAAPEVVADGKSGFLVDNVSQMAEAIGRLDELSPADCRRHARDNFDTSVMVRSYVEVYERMLTREAEETAAVVDRVIRQAAPEASERRAG